MIELQFPDGASRQYPDGSTGRQVAEYPPAPGYAPVGQAEQAQPGYWDAEQQQRGNWT